MLFAALTSAIALSESAVSTFEDELGMSRKGATLLMTVLMILLGSLSSLGYGPLANIKVIGMQFLDFFDFITNSIMMPIGALFICVLVFKVIGIKKVDEEMQLEGQSFRMKKAFGFMVKYLCPIFVVIILITSVLTAMGIVKF